MKAYSALLAIYGEFTGHRWTLPTKASDAELWYWSNGWVNNREAGDMKRQLTHYDVIVMYYLTNMLRGSRGSLI